MPSLALIEAVERARLLTVSNYRVVLDLPEYGAEFGSDTTITFACAEPGASTFLDVRPVGLDLLELNGERLDPTSLVDGRVALNGLRAENVLRVVARMAYSTDGEGLHRHVDPSDGRGYLYAMSFLDAAPRWFACFDQPDLKARYDFEVRCPADWTVLGNSSATEVEAGHWRLSTSQPLSTYFVTLVAGPYYSVLAEHDGIRLGLHARASLAPYLDAEAADLLAVTKASFDRLHELFGVRYPFGEYHQAFVPDFNAGAMENPGCVTLRDQFVYRSAATRGQRALRASTIAHEMAHMWFGDLVTMRWWDDLWLNESFAEYMGYRVCASIDNERATLAWTEFGINRRDWGYVADQTPSSHPVAGNGSLTAAAALADFDGISYAKGASVLKQLAAHLGDEIFFAGLRLHFQRHRFGNATFADLIDAWTTAGAQDLAGWAEGWLRTSGLDTIEAELTGDGTAVLRRRSPDPIRRPHTFRAAAFDADGVQVLDEPVRLFGDEYPLTVPGASRLVVPDSQDETWAKIRFGPGGWQNLARLLPKIELDSTRVLCYNAIRDAVRDAELSPAAALDMVLDAVRAEPIELLSAELLRFATEQLAGAYAEPAQRAGRRRLILQTCQDWLQRAEAASDAQLEAARALIRSCDDVRLLRAWREGQELPPGLVIDSELRWSLVCQLAAHGDLDGADIDAELARDESTAGVVHAARARSLRPNPAAKRAAWQLLVEPSPMPAYELYATADGFFDPSQHELTAAYLPRFFDEMPGTAEHRHGWALSRVITSGFPVAAASPRVLALADAALARPELDGGVRRVFLDCTDALRRSVTALQRYPGA